MRLAEQSRVISVQSWYLTSLVNLSFLDWMPYITISFISHRARIIFSKRDGLYGKLLNEMDGSGGILFDGVKRIGWKKNTLLQLPDGIGIDYEAPAESGSLAVASSSRCFW